LISKTATKPEATTKPKEDNVLQVTADKLTGLQEAFAFFDYDGNGKLDKEEIMQVIQSLGYNPTWAEMELKFQNAD
jgi:Ca2+-binding EF-hand superfamily protein